MIDRKKILLGLGAGAAAMVLSGCVEGGYGYVGFGVPAPPPPAVVVVYPDSYVWDGYEYVGLVGDRYYYLGPRNVWMACEPFRLERFHEWERYHPDWRERAVRNERYRGDDRGGEHDRGHGWDHGHDRDEGR